MRLIVVCVLVSVVLGGSAAAQTEMSQQLKKNAVAATTAVLGDIPAGKVVFYGKLKAAEAIDEGSSWRRLEFEAPQFYRDEGGKVASLTAFTLPLKFFIRGATHLKEGEGYLVYAEAERVVEPLQPQTGYVEFVFIVSRMRSASEIVGDLIERVFHGAQ